MSTKNSLRRKLIGEIGAKGHIKPSSDWPRWMLKAFFIGRYGAAKHPPTLIGTMAAISVYDIKRNTR